MDEMNPNIINYLANPNEPAGWSITSVERDTGISKDTLRMWERRYSFPRPSRDALGERVYPLEQVEKLRIVKRLIDAHFRPGKIIALDIAALQELANQSEVARAVEPAHDGALIGKFLEMIRNHQIEVFRRGLAEHIAKNGITKTITEIIAPLTYSVGEAWRSGNLAIYEEHLFTESVHIALRSAISAIPRQAQAPRVLLTTLPQEPHSLGLLMAESMFAIEGCSTLSLGVQTPMWDIVQAATRQKVDIVALSFSVAMNRQQVQDGLRELRHQLPPRIEIWAGGSSAALNRNVADGVICTTKLDDVANEVKRWRALHTNRLGS
jgi:MerR family transcriptional regulator, light-induced transcriptional regulator